MLGISHVPILRQHKKISAQSVETLCAGLTRPTYQDTPSPAASRDTRPSPLPDHLSHAPHPAAQHPSPSLSPSTAAPPDVSPIDPRKVDRVGHRLYAGCSRRCRDPSTRTREHRLSISKRCWMNVSPTWLSRDNGSRRAMYCQHIRLSLSSHHNPIRTVEARQTGRHTAKPRSTELPSG